MSDERRVRWGILGCAGIAEKAFIPAVLRSRNGALGAVVGPDPAGPEDWGRRFGIPRARRTYQELVEAPAVDAVYNPLSNDLGREALPP